MTDYYTQPFTLKSKIPRKKQIPWSIFTSATCGLSHIHPSIIIHHYYVYVHICVYCLSYLSSLKQWWSELRLYLDIQYLRVMWFELFFSHSTWYPNQIIWICIKFRKLFINSAIWLLLTTPRQLCVVLYIFCHKEKFFHLTVSHILIVYIWWVQWVKMLLDLYVQLETSLSQSQYVLLDHHGVHCVANSFHDIPGRYTDVWMRFGELQWQIYCEGKYVYLLFIVAHW